MIAYCLSSIRMTGAPLLAGFRPEPELQRTALGEIPMIEPTVDERLPIQLRFLDVEVVFRVVLCLDNEGLTRIVARIELDDYLVKLRRGNLINGSFELVPRRQNNPVFIRALTPPIDSANPRMSWKTPNVP